MVVGRDSIIFRAISEVPGAVWAVLLGYFIGFALYQVHQDTRIASLENSDRYHELAIINQRDRTTSLDEHGTRALNGAEQRILEINGRLTNMGERSNEIEKRLRDIEQQVSRNNARLDNLERMRNGP